MVEHVGADVLVVGGGLAGLRAAIEAATLGRKVVLVSKTEPGVDNCSAAAGGHLSGAVGGRDEAGYLAALRQHDEGRADPVLQRVLAYDSGAALSELIARFGVEGTVKHGTISVTGPPRWWGRPMTRRLLDFARDQGVQVRWPICVSRLIVSDGACRGAVGLDLETGATVAIAARSTVMCGGGHSAIYPRHDNPGSPLGDGAAVALEAGAKVRDMEFCKFHALGLAEGPEPQDILVFGLALGKAKIALEDGRAVERRDLPEVWAGRAACFERDDARFDALADMTHLDWEAEAGLKDMVDCVPGAAAARERTVRVSPLAHYTPGGIAVDAQGWTGVPGLYAAGECTGGVFGADRPGGAALTDCVVFGRRAGNEAGRVARDLPLSEQAELEGIDLGGPDCPEELLAQARWLIWNYAGVATTREGLELCGRLLGEIGAQAQGMRPAGVRGFMALHGLRCVTRVGMQVVQARLRRC